MKQIALALLSVGLCFYQVYRSKILIPLLGPNHRRVIDEVACAVALIAAILLFFS